LYSKKSINYIITAGHCVTGRPGNVVLNANGVDVGADDAAYYANGEDDFGAVRLAGSPTVNVWGGAYNSNTLYATYGAEDPAAGTTLAVDGGVAGETRNLTVDEDDGGCFPEKSSQVCHILDVDEDYDTFCVPGDSGGPIFQHTNQDFNDVVDAATIVGTYTDDFGDTHCVGQDVTAELSEWGFSLVTEDGPP
jgi:hypothetical protein